jgi:hypothetical protein
MSAAMLADMEPCGWRWRGTSFTGSLLLARCKGQAGVLVDRFKEAA